MLPPKPEGYMLSVWCNGRLYWAQRNGEEKEARKYMDNLAYVHASLPVFILKGNNGTSIVVGARNIKTE
jgi:hypothetical protein